MTQLTGVNSKIATQISTLESQLEAVFTDQPTILTSVGLALTQWQTGMILNTQELLLENVPTYASMADIGMDFITEPELTFGGSNLDLSFDVAMTLFELYDPTTPDQLTLLNPLMTYKFYYDYHFDRENVATSFGIPIDQVDNLHAYLDEQADNNHLAFRGTTIAKAIYGGL